MGLHDSQDVSPATAPPPGTVERRCYTFIRSESMEVKLAAPVPAGATDTLQWERPAVARRLERPGRPRDLRLVERAPRVPSPGALVRVEARARLVHTFLHHELQAAELFAWAVLAFPDAPRAFRTGLLGLCREELGHLALYERHLAELGFRYGDFPVRDWFWERVASCSTASSFVALLGLGLEGANLEHSARFAQAFRAAGDVEGARILERVEHDEVAHVAFAVRWFERLSGEPLDYATWRAALPAPLTPAVLRGRPLNRPARLKAGLDASFLAQLEAEPSTTQRRPV